MQAAARVRPVLFESACPDRVLVDLWLVPRRVFSCGPCEGVFHEAKPAVLDFDAECHRHRPPRLYRRGVNLSNLRRLSRALPAKEDYSLTKRLTLINVRSLSNKTFILHEFFKAKELDLLFLTETWVCSGDLTPFSESVPLNCNFLNKPRLTGRGGGLAVIFKNSLNCKTLQADAYSTFELQLFQIKVQTGFLVCALIYRPPKFNKNFIQQFAEFVSGLLCNYDCFLILGDFNVHVCYPSDPLVKDFLNLIESFNLLQHVHGSTHIHGHTLDLVISSNQLNFNVIMDDVAFSDHKSVTFELSFDHEVKNLVTPSRCVRNINSTTADCFTNLFIRAPLTPMLENPPLQCDVEKLLNVFNSTCSDALDCVAPARNTLVKPKLQPWLNESTRVLRRECRKAERRWKKGWSPAVFRDF